MTVIKRKGNKSKIAHLIYPLFKECTTYIEPFFGAGGMFFNKPVAKYNILNDLDSDIFNVWNVFQNCDKLEEFIELWGLIPIDQNLIKYWGTHTGEGLTEVQKAIKFVYLCNYCLFSDSSTLRARCSNPNTRALVLEEVKKCLKFLNCCSFYHMDYLKFLDLIPSQLGHTKGFIYCDPPYGNTSASYKGFSEKDMINLFEKLNELNYPWAVSGYDCEFLDSIIEKNNYVKTYIKETRTILKRNVEILITNYLPNQILFYL